MSVDNWINLCMLIATILLGGGSLWFTHKQWQKVEKKIAMINDAGRAFEILPAWYTSRMMQDWWIFGLLTSDGRILVVTRITALSDDGQWMDVELVEENSWSIDKKSNYVFAVAKDRTKASIHVSHIVAAMELITS